MTAYIVLDHVNRPLAVFASRADAERYSREQQLGQWVRIVERPYYDLKEVA